MRVLSLLAGKGAILAGIALIELPAGAAVAWQLASQDRDPLLVVFAAGVGFALPIIGVFLVLRREREDRARKDDERHQENRGDMEALTSEVKELNDVLHGVRGSGGLVEESQEHQDRRHDLITLIGVVILQLIEIGKAVSQLCALQKIDFDMTQVDRELVKALAELRNPKRRRRSEGR